ncbi:MAG: DUF4142 domain-containing protein [Pseudoxanthomonas sp.]
MQKSLIATSVLLALTLAACSKPGDDASRTAPAPSPAPTTASVPGQTQAPTREPAEIAGVVAAIGDTQVAISKVLLDRGVEGPLADFAKELQTTHQQIADKARALGATASGTHVQVQQGKQRAEVESLTKEQDEQALMNAYIAAVVRDHDEALSQLDAELIPAAQGELKEYLQQVRKQVAEALERAQALASARY